VLRSGCWLRDNLSVVICTVWELFLAAVASRSLLVGALLSTADPANRDSIESFIQGLSRDELECIAEFQGACIIDSEFSGYSEYRLLAEFFDANCSDRWQNPNERAHKTFVVLAWLDLRKSVPRTTISLAIS
jgi:hypothetical protein